MAITNGQTADADEVLEMTGRLAAQNTNRILKSDTSVFVNEQYSGADDFTDSDGVMNTVDTGNSTAVYRSSNEEYILSTGSDLASGDATANGGFTNPENAFDSDDGTNANYSVGGDTTNPLTKTLGKTFSSKNVTKVTYKVGMNNEYSGGATIKLQTYNGSTWTDVTTVQSGNGTTTGTYYLENTIEGIRFEFQYNDGTISYKNFYLYTLEYSQFTSPNTVETNSIISDIIPDSIVVYGETDLPTNTSITVDVSDDGGTTFGVTGQNLDTAIDTSSFTTGNLALKFNLATTDASVTPKLYGYGVAITDT